MQAVILAAGCGTRLMPLTRVRSKAMLPILGVPIIERIIADIAACGINDFIIVAQPQDKDLTNHFQRMARLDANLQIVHQTEPRGMAHALKCAAPYIQGDFLLSACDNLVPADSLARMLSFWGGQQALKALLALMPVSAEKANRSAVVELDGNQVRRIVEKPPPEGIVTGIASLPLYCFTPRLLDFLPLVKRSPRGEYELQDAIQMLIEREGHVHGFTVPERMTLTSPDDLLAINRHCLLEEQARGGSLLVEPQSVGVNTNLREPLWVGPGTHIGANCTIGPLVYIEGDCTVGDNTSLRESVVLRGTTISSEADIYKKVLPE